jgi:hypothetical protein
MSSLWVEHGATAIGGILVASLWHPCLESLQGLVPDPEEGLVHFSLPVTSAQKCAEVRKSAGLGY